MAGPKYETRHFSGLKVFKGTVYGPAKDLPERSKRNRQMTKAEMDFYDRKVARTKGFDVDGCTGSLSGRIVPVSEGAFQWKISGLLAEYVCSEHCESVSSKDQYVVYRSLLKANIQGVMGFLYYLTFTALDFADSEIKTYRARVWLTHNRLIHTQYFKEYKPPMKRVTSRKARKTLGSKSSKGNKRAVAKKKTAVLSGGSVLAGFTALLNEMKSQNPSLKHSVARSAASKKWKTLSNTKKQSYISKASLKPKI